MIKVVNGDILHAPENMIVHQVNCMGVMGAGLAKQIRNKYPNVYTEYVDLINKYQNKRKSLLGATQFIHTHDGKIVVNLFG